MTELNKADIIVATTYIFKLNLPKFDLSAVILAELGLGLPDFRSSENVFRNLYRVAGMGNKVYFQTFSPYNKTLKLALERNFNQFYKRELEARKKELFPPYSQMVRLILEGKDKEKIQREVSYLAGELKSLSATFPESYEVLGPTEAFKKKNNSKYRYSLLILGKNLYPALSLVPNNFKVDVDPVNSL